MKEKKAAATETQSEWLKRRKTICVKCVYDSRLSTENKYGSTCDYLLKTGHKRPCKPSECVEKGVFTPKKARRKKPEDQKGESFDGGGEGACLAGIVKTRKAKGETIVKENKAEKYEIDQDVLDVIGLYVDKVYNAEDERDKLRAADQLCGALDMMTAIITKEQ